MTYAQYKGSRLNSQEAHQSRTASESQAFSILVNNAEGLLGKGNQQWPATTRKIGSKGEAG